MTAERKRQTIYEYHRVEVEASRIVSKSAFVFTPLPSEYLLMRSSADRRWLLLLLLLLSFSGSLWFPQLVSSSHPASSA